ncbi:precorrin-3B synthase [Bradyrhizobium roseum]|uniref:precorrin-3B synthase n=1 Tax=Bradyrhizobium roseum TaxID=3056648 RepID=UPI0026210E97|nr:precorrin-3B synthase [Bradyrhizobium roseus]WKA30308.1 precorrin-3B synthase [Bradyrhizobium roseus]
MAEPVIQGWCPGALRPMPSGDGWVIRVRPPGGRLTPQQAREIARLARTHGNGVIDLSSRANIHLRGVTERSHVPLIEGLDALGLIDDNPEAEERRNIVLSPFWSANDGSVELATALAKSLTAPDTPQLPAKFGFAVDCGPRPVLTHVSADIRLERDANGGLICRADGAAKAARVSAANAVSTMLALADWFIRSGGVAGERGRMAAHLARGAALPEIFSEVPAPSAASFSPEPGPVAQGVMVGFAFGQVPAELLDALSEHGALRVTPWRMLLIEDIGAMPDLPGLITRPHDPMLRVMACTGAPGCLQAAQPTRALASALAPHLPDGAILHVSGCAKGCAHPRPAAFTLTAHAEGFDLIRDGHARDLPLHRGMTAERLAAHPAILREAL